jgi:hypothetical protein
MRCSALKGAPRRSRRAVGGGVSVERRAKPSCVECEANRERLSSRSATAASPTELDDPCFESVARSAALLCEDEAVRRGPEESLPPAEGLRKAPGVRRSGPGLRERPCGGGFLRNGRPNASRPGRSARRQEDAARSSSAAAEDVRHRPSSRPSVLKSPPPPSSYRR